MRLRCAYVLAIAVAGCSFGDPALDSALFKCDSTHACPDELTCTGSPGLCLLSGPGQDGVLCGGAGICAAGQKCCDDATNPARCLDATDACPGGTQAFCDGREDCASGAHCCQGTSDILCARDCLTTICLTTDDCPTTEPNCCLVMSSSTPWLRQCSLDPC